MRFSGKRALVTGAASGIGKAVVSRFLQEGAEVFGADLAYADSPSPGTGGPIALKLNVAIEDDWQQLLEKISPIDVMVACAGISDARSIEECSLNDWRRVMQVNLEGAFLSVKYGRKAMQARKGGAIVLVGSVSGIKAAPGASAYCVSKAGVRMLARTAALEFKKDAVRVNCVSPAGVVTPMWQKMPFWQTLVAQHGGEQGAWDALGGTDPRTPSLLRMAFPEEIASAIIFLCSEESAHITGTELVVDGGYSL
jgi:NAD(P)-dependent dehydrogenase (short-subunit alcohol dehydrogenase family)